MNYKYSETEENRKLLNEIEALRIVFEKLPILPHIEENIRRNSLLKSALFSAKIEGIVKDTYDDRKLEVQNLLRAYKAIYQVKFPKKVTLESIYKLHKIAMNHLSSHAGKLRQEPWAIFNQAGVAVYLAPAHFNLPGLMDDYLETISQFKFMPVVNAAIAQFLFEKIHPFADGNGRVGRLISTLILNNSGFGFRGMVPMEEYIDDQRNLYYEVLEPSQDVNLFVKFFLTGLISQANKTLVKTQEVEIEKPEDLLLPRRREIFEIIKDHPMCSFDLIRRRFTAVNEKTLHYDLLALQKSGFITKIGKTRGALYKAK